MIKKWQDVMSSLDFLDTEQQPSYHQPTHAHQVTVSDFQRLEKQLYDLTAAVHAGMRGEWQLSPECPRHSNCSGPAVKNMTSLATTSALSIPPKSTMTSCSTASWPTVRASRVPTPVHCFQNRDYTGSAGHDSAPDMLDNRLPSNAEDLDPPSDQDTWQDFSDEETPSRAPSSSTSNPADFELQNAWLAYFTDTNDEGVEVSFLQRMAEGMAATGKWPVFMPSSARSSDGLP